MYEWQYLVNVNMILRVFPLEKVKFLNGYDLSPKNWQRSTVFGSPEKQNCRWMACVPVSVLNYTGFGVGYYIIIICRPNKGFHQYIRVVAQHARIECSYCLPVVMVHSQLKRWQEKSWKYFSCKSCRKLLKATFSCLWTVYKNQRCRPIHITEQWKGQQLLIFCWYNWSKNSFVY